MAGLNRRGPNNEGPMTGRRQGLCNPANQENANGTSVVDNNSTFLRGMGRGFGRCFGRCFGRGFGRDAGNGKGFGGNSNI